MNPAANKYVHDEHRADESVAHAHEHHHRHEHDRHDHAAHGDHGAPAARGHAGHDAHGSDAGHDHGHMVADLRKRFWACLLLTLPVLALSPMIQHMHGLEDDWRFAGIWATGYNVIAIPAPAGALAHWGIVLGPAVGAVLMSASTVVSAVNARMLRLN